MESIYIYIYTFAEWILQRAQKRIFRVLFLTWRIEQKQVGLARARARVRASYIFNINCKRGESDRFIGAALSRERGTLIASHLRRDSADKYLSKV